MDNKVRLSSAKLSILLLITLSGIFSAVIFKFSLVIGFLPGLCFLVYTVNRMGLKIRQIVIIGLEGVKKTSGVMWILLLVSMILPTWMLSGTIPQLVSFSLSTISIEYFVLCSFLLSMILSLIIGTSVGALSAIGIPLIAAAEALGLPLSMVAGALVSGAFVGDRTSPLSSAHQLLSHTIEVPVKKQFKAMLPTTITAIIVSVVFYMALDYFKGNFQSVNTGQLFQEQVIPIVFYPLLPPILLLVLVIIKIKIRTAFIASIFLSIIISVLHGISVPLIIHNLWLGAPKIGGGIQSMILLIIFIGLAGFYNGIIEKLQLFQPLINRLMKVTDSLVISSSKTMVASFLITMLACNQTLPIILTGRSLLGNWKDSWGSHEFARIMGDSTMLIPGLIPWSMLAIMCSTVLGIPVLHYVPFAIFLWILPFITLLVSYLKQNATKQFKAFQTSRG